MNRVSRSRKSASRAPSAQLIAGQEEAAGVRIERPAEGQLDAQAGPLQLGDFGDTLKRRGHLGREVAVEVCLPSDAALGDLVAVGQEHGGRAYLVVKPAKLGKEPRVTEDQVILEIAIIIVVAEPFIKCGVAFETQEWRLGVGRLMPKSVTAQGQAREEVLALRRADTTSSFAAANRALASLASRRAMSMMTCGPPNSWCKADTHAEQRLDSRRGVAPKRRVFCTAADFAT